MSVLAHVFENAGLATVVLASTRAVAEKMTPPRALYCEFPLGRPLGRPNDPSFQIDVLARAFALLDESSGPVLVDHPDVIVSEEQPVACQIPPSFDPSVHPAIAEAKGVRNAFERSRERRGVTSVGRVLDPDQIVDGLGVFERIVWGEHWKTVEIPAKRTTGVVHDIRTYYEEAALSLVDAPNPDGRALEAWFYEQTEAGKLIMQARSALRSQEAPAPVWFYMAPAHR